MRIGNFHICKRALNMGAMGVGVGFVIGFGTAYFASRRTIKALEADIEFLDNEIDGNIQHIYDLETQLRADSEEDAIKVSDARKKEIMDSAAERLRKLSQEDEEPEDISNVLQAYGNESYDKYLDEIKSEEAYDDGVEVIEVAEDGPYEIAYTEFFNTNKDYDKISLEYYVEDDILADENNEPVDNVEAWIGPKEILDRFREFDGDEVSVIYVRNSQVQCDYEIVRNPNKYFNPFDPLDEDKDF